MGGWHPSQSCFSFFTCDWCATGAGHTTKLSLFLVLHGVKAAPVCGVAGGGVCRADSMGDTRCHK